MSTDISRQVALACEWKCGYDPKPLLGSPLGMFHCPECGAMQLAGLPHIDDEDVFPDFEHSLDACFGPGGPIEWLEEHGFWWALEFTSRGRADFCVWTQDVVPTRTFGHNGIPAEAICHTILAAHAACVAEVTPLPSG